MHNMTQIIINALGAAEMIGLLFCADILCSVDVHEARSRLRIFVFLASSTVYSLEVKICSVS